MEPLSRRPLNARARFGAIGPRNRRRLRNGGIAAALVVAVVVTALLIRRSSDDSGSAKIAEAQEHRSTTSARRQLRLVFGMTPRQVRHIAGSPRSIRAGCWYYKPVHGNVGALSTGVPGTPSMTADQIKLCFYSGVLSFEYTHLLTPDKGWQWIEALF